MHTDTVLSVFYCNFIWTSQHNSAIFSNTHTYVRCRFAVWYVCGGVKREDSRNFSIFLGEQV